MKPTPYTYQKARDIETKINKGLLNRGRVTYIRPASGQATYNTPIEFKLNINWKWAMESGDIENTPINTILTMISDMFYNSQMSNENYSLKYDDVAKIDVIDRIRDRSPENPRELVNTENRYTLIFHFPEIPGEKRVSMVKKEAIERGLKPRKRKIDENSFESIKEDVMDDLDSMQTDIEYAYEALRTAHKKFQQLKDFHPKMNEYLSGMAKLGQSLETWHDRLTTFLDDTLPSMKYQSVEQQPKTQEQKPAGQQPKEQPYP
jgi:hypothetical protein